MIDRTIRCFRGDRRQAILDVANVAFSKDGYAATSMSHIAAQLGGSKGTLYSYFRSKEELFEAHIADRCDCISRTIFTPPLNDGDPVLLLTELADRILTSIMSDESLAFYRLVLAEAERSSATGIALYESGPNSGIRQIAALLDRLRQNGHLSVDDCVRAAEEFFALIHGGLCLKRLLNVIQAPSTADIKAEAGKITETFLRAYGRRNL